MVTHERQRIGLDRQGDIFYSARIIDKTGRPEIDTLARIPRSELSSHDLIKGSEIFFSVSDDLTMSKKIQLDQVD